MELANKLRWLADKLFSNLEEQTKEQLFLDIYFSLLDKPELALAVQQKCPKTMYDSVAVTL